MTKILKTEIIVRLELEQIDEHLYQVTLTRGGESCYIIANETEAMEVTNKLGAIIQNNQ